MSGAEKNQTLREKLEQLKAEKRKLDEQRKELIEQSLWNPILFAAISHSMMQRDSELKDRRAAFQAFLSLSSEQQNQILWPLIQQNKEVREIITQLNAEQPELPWIDGLPLLRHIRKRAADFIPVIIVFVVAYNKLCANSIFRINDYKIVIKLLYDLLSKNNNTSPEDWCTQNIVPKRILEIRDQIACPYDPNSVLLIDTILEQTDLIKRIQRSLDGLSSTVNRFNQNRGLFQEKILDSWEVLRWWFRYWMSGKAIGDNNWQFTTWFIRQDPHLHWIEMRTPTNT